MVKPRTREQKMREITIYGLVQGVGFRPFVAEAAQERSISGTVLNAGGIVKVRAASDDDEALDDFIQRLSSCDIPGARVDEIVVTESRDDERFDGFSIVESESFDDQLRILPADMATCEECERQLRDRSNRRYRYPFISCTSCGPRYSIMTALPYDRERTSMSVFKLCDECEADYKRPHDIRRHAQTIACEKCGPKLKLICVGGDELYSEDALNKAIAMLREGKILAVKDIGGFHFCFDPYCDEAGKRLREYKHREQKPFAVMFRDTLLIKEMAHASKTELKLLTSTERPIVLLEKNKDKDFAPSVCEGYVRVGAMLPCNPLQMLLLDELKTLVMTSGNRGGEPIATDDEPMLEALHEGFIDGVLTHDRDIVNGQDDSIYQVTKAGDKEYVQIIRRARGCVPEPIRMNVSFDHDMFAAGADLKNVFALARKNMVYLSPHFGDLDDVRCLKSRDKGIATLESLTGIEPEIAICDRHPEYISTKKTIEEYKTASRIQHHFAHVASVMAEHGLQGDVIGVAFDGTGYGDDGTIWGSEIFRIKGNGYIRAGHFSSVTMTGGDSAALDGNTALNCYLVKAHDRGLLSQGEIDEIVRKKESYELTKKVIGSGINTVKSSSMGRLFDAVSALLGICDKNTHEGECAMKLQAEAEKQYETNPSQVATVWAPIKKEEDMLVADSVYLISMLAKSILYGEEKGELALQFHMAIADALVQLIMELNCKDQPVVLSGGCMCNSLLLKLMIPMFAKSGHEVYLNEKVPCTDGGIALGQLFGNIII